MSAKRRKTSREQAESWKSMLLARPVRNAAAIVRNRAADTVSISVKTVPKPYHVPPVTWVIRVPPMRTSHLDRLGSDVWALCDGVRTVEQVVDAFASRHGLTFHEARVSVTAYMKSLVQRGALVIAMEKAPAS